MFLIYLSLSFPSFLVGHFNTYFLQCSRLLKCKVMERLLIYSCYAMFIYATKHCTIKDFSLTSRNSPPVVILLLLRIYVLHCVSKPATETARTVLYKHLVLIKGKKCSPLQFHSLRANFKCDFYKMSNLNRTDLSFANHRTNLHCFLKQNGNQYGHLKDITFCFE